MTDKQAKELLSTISKATVQLMELGYELSVDTNGSEVTINAKTIDPAIKVGKTIKYDPQLETRKTTSTTILADVKELQKQLQDYFNKAGDNE